MFDLYITVSDGLYTSIRAKKVIVTVEEKLAMLWYCNKKGAQPYHIMANFIFKHSKLDRLAKRMKEGNIRAADELYRELIDKVFGFCLSRIRHRHIAEDLTQEIFLKLVSKIETFDPKKGRFTVWFWQIARNTLFDHYRRQKEVAFADIGEGESVERLASVESSEKALDYKIAKERLENFIESLGSDDRELFELRYVAELSYREISKILEKPEGNLRVAVSRLAKKVRQSLR